MDIKSIIKEAMDRNPLGLKESIEEELRTRIALSLEAKMTDTYKEDAGEWEFSEVEKRSGVWGWFETHIPTGRSRFLAFNTRTKKEAMERREKYIANNRK